MKSFRNKTNVAPQSVDFINANMANKSDYALTRGVNLAVGNPVTTTIVGAGKVLANPFKTNENKTNLVKHYRRTRTNAKEVKSGAKFDRKVLVTGEAEDFTPEEQDVLRKFAVKRIHNGLRDCAFSEVLLAIRDQVNPAEEVAEMVTPASV